MVGGYIAFYFEAQINGNVKLIKYSCKSLLSFIPTVMHPSCYASLLSCFPSVCLSCPASLLSCLPPVLPPSCPVSLLSCIPPVLPSSFSLLSCLSPVLHPSSPVSFFLPPVPPLLRPSCPVSLLYCLPPVLPPSCPTSLLSYLPSVQLELSSCPASLAGKISDAEVPKRKYCEKFSSENLQTFRSKIKMVRI